MESDQIYLHTVISPLLEHPSDISIERTIDERGVLLTLTVNKIDMGKVIGKQGDMARSLRRLLRQFGTLNKASVALKINEPSN